MNKFDSFVTYLVLPYYWIRSQYLRRFGKQETINKEMKRYPNDYFGFRKIKVVAHGTQVNPNQKAIFVSNHQSRNDIFVTLSAINRPFRFIAKKELFTNLITGTFMKMSQSYPLDREDPRKSLTLLKQAVKDVKTGASVLVFPEGTRSYQKDMLEFKDGLFSMLRKADAPIVVLYIKESYNEKQDTIHVYMSEPIQPETYNKLKGVELSKLTFDIMNELKEKAYA